MLMTTAFPGRPFRSRVSRSPERSFFALLGTRRTLWSNRVFAQSMKRIYTNDRLHPGAGVTHCEFVLLPGMADPQNASRARERNLGTAYRLGVCRIMPAGLAVRRPGSGFALSRAPSRRCRCNVRVQTPKMLTNAVCGAFSCRTVRSHRCPITLPGHTSASDSTPCTPDSTRRALRAARADESAGIPALP